MTDLGHPRPGQTVIGNRAMAAADREIAARLWPDTGMSSGLPAVRPAPGLPLFRCTVCGRAPDRVDYREKSDDGQPGPDAPTIHHVLIWCHGSRGSWSITAFELDSFRYELEAIEVPDMEKRWGARR